MILHASVVCISLSHGVGEPIPYARGNTCTPYMEIFSHIHMLLQLKIKI